MITNPTSKTHNTTTPNIVRQRSLARVACERTIFRCAQLNRPSCSSSLPSVTTLMIKMALRYSTFWQRTGATPCRLIYNYNALTPRAMRRKKKKRSGADTTKKQTDPLLFSEFSSACLLSKMGAAERNGEGKRLLEPNTAFWFVSCHVVSSFT